VAFVADAAPIVVFSSGQPGQGGVHPVNKRPRADWIQDFERRGMREQADLSARLAQAFREARLPGEYLAENVIVMVRDGEPPAA
jgi:hypothetical protein